MFILLVLPALALAAGLAILWPPAGSERALFRISPGESVSGVSAHLRQQGFLSPWQSKLLRIYGRVSDLPRNLKAGGYSLPRPVSLRELVRSFDAGPSYRFRIAIPEGKTCREIAAMVEQTQLVGSGEFSALCTDSTFAESLGIPAASLEGYLFPDTYFFDGSEDARAVARTLHDRFQAVWDSLTDSLGAGRRSEVLAAKGMHGTVTLASIVEREAVDPSESNRIAGVFYRRLQLQIPLGADPTVRYILNKPRGSLTARDLQVASPYNTRIYPGLPPGPISNPGRHALWASLFPDSSDLLYFVGKDDGSRQHYFARSYAEHLRFKKQASDNRIVSGVAPP